jgi:hypothetical protein
VLCGRLRRLHSRPWLRAGFSGASFSEFFATELQVDINDPQ